MTTTNVADLVCELHADELRGVSDVLARYVALVQKVASGKTLAADEAVSAASCAYELRLPPDRFDRDAAAMRAVMSLEAQIVEDEKVRATARQDNENERQKLAELQRAVTEQQLRMRRIYSLAMERQTRRSQRDDLRNANPHLFVPAAALTDNQWAAVRH